MKRFSLFPGAVAFGFFAASLAQAETVTLTDIAGRQVQVETPVQRVILGEGRQAFFTAVLETEKVRAAVVRAARAAAERSRELGDELAGDD